jgi:hypothetical protein
VSLCYDDEARRARRKTKGSAVGMAETMGIELLTEGEYFALQKLGDFDRSGQLIKTPADFRAKAPSGWPQLRPRLHRGNGASPTMRRAD